MPRNLTQELYFRKILRTRGCITFWEDRRGPGREKESLRWLKSAAELDENNHTYIYAYADRCFETGDRRSAETLLYQSASAESPGLYLLKRRAILLEKRGEDEAAIADVRSSLKIHPNDAKPT